MLHVDGTRPEGSLGVRWQGARQRSKLISRGRPNTRGGSLMEVRRRRRVERDALTKAARALTFSGTQTRSDMPRRSPLAQGTHLDEPQTPSSFCALTIAQPAYPWFRRWSQWLLVQGPDFWVVLPPTRRTVKERGLTCRRSHMLVDVGA